MSRPNVWCAGLAAALTTVSVAQAQTQGDHLAPVVDRPITLPKHGIELRAEAMIDISAYNRAFKSVSLAPDVYFGVNDDLQLGINHSQTMGVYTGPGTAPLCIGGNNYCKSGAVYDQVAFDAKYRFFNKHKFQIAGHGIVGAQSLDPFGLASRVGAVARWNVHRMVALDFTVAFGFGMSNRDRSFAFISAGNKEYLYHAARATVQLTEQAFVFGDVYSVLAFEHTGDLFRIGTNVGGGFSVTKNIDLGGELRLPFLIHSGDGVYDRAGGFGVRQIGGFANFRF